MNTKLFHYHHQAEQCPQCGSELQIRQGKKGLFLGCSAYPDCDYLKPLHAQSEGKVLKQLDQNCPECQSPLVLRQGHFGMFIGCSNYPNCHFIVQEQPEIIDSPLTCPECRKGQLVARRGQRGKTFYACDQFPQCKFSLPSKPIASHCPQCGYSVAMIKKEKDDQLLLQCANKSCAHRFYQEKKNEP